MHSNNRITLHQKLKGNNILSFAKLTSHVARFSKLKNVIGLSDKEFHLRDAKNFCVVLHTDADWSLRSFPRLHHWIRPHERFCIKLSLLSATNSLCTVLKQNL